MCRARTPNSTPPRSRQVRARPRGSCSPRSVHETRLWGPCGGLAAAGAATHTCPADPLEALSRAAPASRHSGAAAREHWTGNSQQLKPVVRVRCGRDYWCNLAAGGIVCWELHAAVRCRGPGRWQLRCVPNAMWCYFRRWFAIVAKKNSQSHWLGCRVERVCAGGSYQQLLTPHIQEPIGHEAEKP